jgi:hypothetical protein
MSKWKHEPQKVNFPPFLGELRPKTVEFFLTDIFKKYKTVEFLLTDILVTT